MSRFRKQGVLQYDDVQKTGNPSVCQGYENRPFLNIFVPRSRADVLSVSRFRKPAVSRRPQQLGDVSCTLPNPGSRVFP